MNSAVGDETAFAMTLIGIVDEIAAMREDAGALELLPHEAESFDRMLREIEMRARTLLVRVLRTAGVC